MLLVGGAAAAPRILEQEPRHANGVPQRILSRLTRGVNVTRWFCYGGAHDTKHFADYWTDGDFQNLRLIGARFVRLCVSPDVIYRNGEPDKENLPYVERAIERLEKAGLVVILDLHDNGQLKVDAPGQDNSGFVRFWEGLARTYRGHSEDSTVFELLNEPVFTVDPHAWYELQRRTVAAIRRIDPARTIMVTSTSWSGIDTLAKMEPLPERNLVYTFHCYDPFVFTHQGATWTGEQQKALRDIPFPSSPEAVAAMISEIPTQYRGAVEDYGRQRLGKAYLRDRIESAMSWADRNRVPLVLGEFGAYPPVSPPASRGRWFDAMHDVIEELHVPNCIWGYDDGFGLGREVLPDGRIKLDGLTLEHFYKVKP